MFWALQYRYNFTDIQVEKNAASEAPWVYPGMVAPPGSETRKTPGTQMNENQDDCLYWNPRLSGSPGSCK